jgi:hypothetical protein
MTKGGRFGKYGEQKRFKRLRQKAENPFLPKKLINSLKRRSKS